MYDTSLHPQIMRDRYAELPEEIKDLFDHATVELVLDSVASQFNLTEEQKELLRMEVELVLFLFAPRQELSERIQESLEIDGVKSKELTGQIENDLFILVDDTLAAAEIELDKSAEGDSSQVALSTPDSKTFVTGEVPISSPPIAEPENTVPNQVKPLRTFAMDVDVSRAHGYGAFQSGEDSDDEPVHHSSQDDIIKK